MQRNFKVKNPIEVLVIKDSLGSIKNKFPKASPGKLKTQLYREGFNLSKREVKFIDRLEKIRVEELVYNSIYG